MTELGTITWPPPELITDRLLLRLPLSKDRQGLIELFSSAEVGTFIGGARPADELAQKLPEVPEQRSGLFIVDLNGSMIGIVTLAPRATDRPGHIRPEGLEAELGYMFLPDTWGKGYATEATRAVLDWFVVTHPGEPVVTTIAAENSVSVRVAEKLGFSEISCFEEYGAQQWFGVFTVSEHE